MATQSFLKNVNIKSKKQIRDFVKALEKTENFNKQNNTSYSRTPYEVKNNEVETFLKKVRWSD